MDAGQSLKSYKIGVFYEEGTIGHGIRLVGKGHEELRMRGLDNWGLFTRSVILLLIEK